MKLYVVTAGYYSDYHIVGVFESEEKAKLYVEKELDKAQKAGII